MKDNDKELPLGGTIAYQKAMESERKFRSKVRKVKSSDSGCDCKLPIVTNPLAPISPEEDAYNYKRHE